MKQQKTPKFEKGKANKEHQKDKELQKNGVYPVVPEIDKDVLKVPPASKEQPSEKDTPNKE